MAANTVTSRHILIVEDDRALRYALAGLLTNAGHVVDQAGDGPEALLKLESTAFDIVLLDVGLPTMSGLDVLAQARATSSHPATSLSLPAEAISPKRDLRGR